MPAGLLAVPGSLGLAKHPTLWHQEFAELPRRKHAAVKESRQRPTMVAPTQLGLPSVDVLTKSRPDPVQLPGKFTASSGGRQESIYWFDRHRRGRKSERVEAHAANGGAGVVKSDITVPVIRKGLMSMTEIEVPGS